MVGHLFLYFHNYYDKVLRKIYAAKKNIGLGQASCNCYTTSCLELNFYRTTTKGESKQQRHWQDKATVCIIIASKKNGQA
jgi:hypothetical protein